MATHDDPATWIKSKDPNIGLAEAITHMRRMQQIIQAKTNLAISLEEDLKKYADDFRYREECEKLRKKLESLGYGEAGAVWWCPRCEDRVSAFKNVTTGSMKCSVCKGKVTDKISDFDVVTVLRKHNAELSRRCTAEVIAKRLRNRLRRIINLAVDMRSGAKLLTSRRRRGHVRSERSIRL